MESLEQVCSVLFQGEIKFRLAEIPGAGRGILATKQIKPGEIIFQEEPTVLGILGINMQKRKPKINLRKIIGKLNFKGKKIENKLKMEAKKGVKTWKIK